MHNPVSLLTVLFLVYINVDFCISQAPFQAAIGLKQTVNSYQNVSRLCNAAIVHDRIVLTAAGCMQVESHKSIAIFDPSMILVYAGNPNGQQIVRSVKSIDIAPNFNAISLENDLAMLVLNESLPLGKKDDIAWIMMEDRNVTNQTCLGTFVNYPLKHVQSPLITHPVVVEKQNVCNALGNYTYGKRHDICSMYVINPGLLCNATANDLKHSIDRGTPLVCPNKVVGLLSSVIAPTTSAYKTNCLERRLYSAYYTPLAPHLNWIYHKISTEKPNVVSPSYVGTPPPFTTAPTHLKKKNNGNSLRSEYYTIATLVVLLMWKIFC